MINLEKLLRAWSGALGALVGLVEEHLAEDVVVDLQPRHRRRSLLLPPAHHDGVRRSHLQKKEKVEGGSLKHLKSKWDWYSKMLLQNRWHIN